jgi:hypothetical protein
MARLLEGGFVVEDQCEFSFPPDLVLLTGQIACVDQISLDVLKRIEILSGSGPSAIVQTKSFRYHAWVRGAHNIFRYCSPHGHRPYAHKHVYDPFDDGREGEMKELRKEADIPLMSQVLEELQAWHEANIERLKELR